MLVEMKNVTKVYGQDSQTQVYGAKNVTLGINKGDFVAVIGPSGSGKTTLLNLMAGLQTPTEGQILFNQKPIHQYSLKDRTHHRLMNMGFVFQDYQLLPILTCFENIELPLQLQAMSKSQIHDRVLWALKEVGLEGLGHRYPSQLSGGQQQRVAIARAIASKPLLILADEPTANLDSKTAQDIIELFKKLNKDYHLTFLFSTHDPRLITQVSRVIKVSDGQIIE